MAPSRYSPEVRERAVRMVREHGAEHPSQWPAIASIAGKLGCTAETLRRPHAWRSGDDGRVTLSICSASPQRSANSPLPGSLLAFKVLLVTQC
jgi:transposase-like protein